MVARVPLFRHLPPAQLAEITALLHQRHLPPRYTVIRRGEHPEAMYFIDQGRVVMRMGERRVVLGPGSFFGELALLEGRPREATVITLTACRLLELDAGDFHRLIGGDPELRRNLLAEARERARAIGHPPPGAAGSDPVS
jgi:CRP-like cAMP-binding protein